MRIFIAIDCKPVNDQLLSLQKQLEGINGRLLTDFHLTLKFIGEASDLQINYIDKQLSELKITPFSIQINHLGEFSSHKQKVIWAGIKPNIELTKLQKMVDSALKDQFQLVNNFYPHISLMRINKSNLKRINAEQIDKVLGQQDVSIYLDVSSIQLMKSSLDSSGAKYEVIKQYPVSGFGEM